MPERLVQRSTSPKFPGSFAWHCQTVIIFLRHFSPWISVVPIAAFGLILLSAYSSLSWATGKGVQELFGPSMLVTACLYLSAILWMLQGRRFWHWWLMLLVVSLICREWHFRGTSTGIYVALSSLFVYGSLKRNALRPLIENRLAMTLCGGALVSYAAAVTMDIGLWKAWPHFDEWGINAEESMESVGHLFILAMVIASTALPAEISRQAETNSEEELQRLAA